MFHPVLALLVSLVCLFLSAYVMLTNRQFLKAKVKTDLLPKNTERYHSEVKSMKLSAAEMESYRQNIEGMLL